MKRTSKLGAFAIIPAFALFLFNNCQRSYNIEQGDPLLSAQGDPTNNELQVAEPPVTVSSPEPSLSAPVDQQPVSVVPAPVEPPPAICSDVLGGTAHKATNGLVGSLYYAKESITDENARSLFPSSQSLIDLSVGEGALVVKSDKDIYLNQIAVAPRAFDTGFPLNDGTELLFPSGNKIVEWFALRLASNLALSLDEEEGFYQLAFVSDDGVLLDIAQEGGKLRLISDDDFHSPTMNCGTEAIELKHNQPSPINIQYFQGPRTEIAFSLLWKKVSSKNSALDANCGKSSYDLSNGQPYDRQRSLTQALSNGWQVIPSKNYILPEEKTNPCVIK